LENEQIFEALTNDCSTISDIVNQKFSKRRQKLADADLSKIVVRKADLVDKLRAQQINLEQSLSKLEKNLENNETTNQSP